MLEDRIGSCARRHLTTSTRMLCRTLLYLVFFSCEESLVYDRIGITKIAAKCILVVAVIQVKSVFYAFGNTFGLSKTVSTKGGCGYAERGKECVG